MHSGLKSQKAGQTSKNEVFFSGIWGCRIISRVFCNLVFPVEIFGTLSVASNSPTEIDMQVFSETRSKTTKIKYSEYMHEQSKNPGIFHQRNAFYSRRYVSFDNISQSLIWVCMNFSMYERDTKYSMHTQKYYIQKADWE